jgi:hemoglobin-like flavoprotein
MTPEKIALVQNSFRQVAPIADAAADIFYDRLFEIAPETRSLFPADMSDQKKKLMQMLGVAVNGLTNLDAILPAVQDLGRRHEGYSVTDAHYDSVGAALLFTLEKGLGEAFTPEVKDAWTETYVTLAGVMKDAQQQARTPTAVAAAATTKPGGFFARIFGR